MTFYFGILSSFFFFPSSQKCFERKSLSVGVFHDSACRLYGVFPGPLGQCISVTYMVGHLFQNYDTIYVRFFPTYTCNHSYGRPLVSKLWNDIRAVFSHVYLQSFLLHDIRAFFATYTCVRSCFVGFLFPSIRPFSYKRAYICAPYICVTNKHVYNLWGLRKSSYKRHRIITSTKNSFMYDGAEK